MKTFSAALADLGLQTEIEVLPVQSGYPSPKAVNLILRRVGGQTFLFESSAARPDIVKEIHDHLERQRVSRLDALLVTHCHGDHAGSAGVVAGYGRPDGQRAPIYLSSAGYRFVTHPDAAFLQETHELFVQRAQFGLIEYSTVSRDDLVEHAIRKQFRGYFARAPKSALRFVDQGAIPDGILAVPTPGHSNDCVLYFDPALGVAVPGDTIICTGAPDRPDTHGFVIPIFTVAGQSYSMAYEGYLLTVRRLRKFFQTHGVRVILPPHGKFAVTEPMSWVAFAEGYFRGIYEALVHGYFGDAARRSAPFRACDLNAFIPSAGAHPISTPSHTFGMLCSLVDDGFLDMQEDPGTRQITFSLRDMPPADHVERRLALDPGPVPVFRTGHQVS